VLQHARRIVRSYNTPVTLRQLFYRLVADGTLPNTWSYYARLSNRTAEGRREGTFPELADLTSGIKRNQSFTGLSDATEWLLRVYCRDRTEGQEWTIFLAVEKAGMSAQLSAWFTRPLGIPHVALGGFASQTLCDRVRRDVRYDRRPAVLVYAGDHDPSGEDIDRDFVARTGCWEKVIRVALSRDQVAEYDLPENTDPEVAAKVARDPRAAQFQAEYGDLAQYEVDALPPEVLRGLYQEAIDRFWHSDAYDAVMRQERDDRDRLRDLVAGQADGDQ
jgi:hypothetical protein